MLMQMYVMLPSLCACIFAFEGKREEVAGVSGYEYPFNIWGFKNFFLNNIDFYRTHNALTVIYLVLYCTHIQCFDIRT